ncbi:DNA polymerase, partial [Staphylococcus aureus]|uniref:DNA polymerase n=1 Tax=Staphylococcus aureus TaxID=1280 RepID=UPI0021B3C4E7
SHLSLHHTNPFLKLITLKQHHTLIPPQPKPLNFPILYPITHYPLTQTLPITPKKPKPFIHHYLPTFPPLKQYISHILKHPKALPYLQTLLHPRRYIPHITSPNFNLPGFPQPTPINTPIHPTPPHIIKLPMLKFAQKIKH